MFSLPNKVWLTTHCLFNLNHQILKSCIIDIRNCSKKRRRKDYKIGKVCKSVLVSISTLCTYTFLYSQFSNTYVHFIWVLLKKLKLKKLVNAVLWAFELFRRQITASSEKYQIHDLVYFEVNYFTRAHQLYIGCSLESRNLF